MDATALHGLLESISEWERKLSIGMDNPDNIKLGTQSCPLCWLYNKSAIYACDGCPIYNYTGQLFCGDTPYRECASTVRALRETPSTNDPVEDERLLREWKSTWKRNAQDMIDFMKRLIPADCNPNGE